MGRLVIFVERLLIFVERPLAETSGLSKTAQGDRPLVSTEKMELRSVIAEHLLSQARACYLDLHRATARERYELLLQRCPGIVEYLDLQDIASFLNVTPKTISMIRKDITFGKD